MALGWAGLGRLGAGGALPAALWGWAAGGAGAAGMLPGALAGSVRWMAVPKRKTSPHRRGLRRRHQQLKPRAEVARCGCGQVLLAHQMCPKCLMAGGSGRRASLGPAAAAPGGGA